MTTVRGAFMIDKETGYIKLGDFSETSNDEVGDALKALTAKGMKRLVFDLRDNPGGPLDQAIRISNRFLPKGELIVYTKGRTPNSNEDYRATEDSDYTHQPLVVLVNRSSASASEIVSGALQDHDRGLVVGETTFGKALVQSVYTIGARQSGAGLALTTGRYYTPSGRMIQRPWDGAFDEYLTYSLRDQSGRAAARLGGAALHRRQAQGVRRRRHRARQVPRRPGRRVQPDALRPHALGAAGVRELRRSVHRRRRHAAERREQEPEADRARVRGDRRDGERVQGARSRRRRSRSTRTSFAKDDAFIRAMIHYDIDLALFGVEEARRNLIAKDPQAQFALQQFPDAGQADRAGRARGATGNERDR